MMKTYIRVEFSSEGESPKQVIERMRKIGATPVVGDYDFEILVDAEGNLFDKIEEIHQALRGSGVRYFVATKTGHEGSLSEVVGEQVSYVVDDKPVELRKKIYKSKLDRWKEMGIDVSELELLLEEDLNRFREASKQFLKEHLDVIPLVRDIRPVQYQMDGRVLALVDESGKTLEDLVRETGYTEAQVTLSLGRLISAGSVTREQKGSWEFYCLVPPPAPVIRKPLLLAPAKDDHEAEERALKAIPDAGVTASTLVRVSRLPRNQVAKALESLLRQGKISLQRTDKKEVYRRV